MRKKGNGKECQRCAFINDGGGKPLVGFDLSWEAEVLGRRQKTREMIDLTRGVVHQEERVFLQVWMMMRDSYDWVPLRTWTHFNEITGWRPSFKLKADMRLPSLLLWLNPIYMRRVGVWCFVTLHLRPLRWALSVSVCYFLSPSIFQTLLHSRSHYFLILASAQCNS